MQEEQDILTFFTIVVNTFDDTARHLQITSTAIGELWALNSRVVHVH